MRFVWVVVEQQQFVEVEHAGHGELARELHH